MEQSEGAAAQETAGGGGAATGASREWANWAGSFRCQPTAYYQPRGEDEIVAAIEDTRRHGGTLRAVGAGHSWSDIVCTDGGLLNLDRHGRVLHVDRQRRQVTVEAGIRLRDLVVALRHHGLALRNLGSVKEQSIAGATATGTHGTGLGFGCLSTQIVSMRLATGTGEVLDLGPEDGALFEAARLSLGCLGVVTQVTLQCEEDYDLEERSWTLGFEAGLAALPTLVAQHEHVKLWWLPHTDQIQVYAFRRTVAPRTPKLPMEDALEEAINERIFPRVLGIGGRLKAVVPAINALVAASYFRPRHRVRPYEEIFCLPMPPVHLEAEFGVPLEAASEALRRIRELIEARALRVNFITELRFVAADDLLLSPAHGRDSCQIGAYCAETGDHDAYFRGVEAIARDLDGRPHWAKTFDMGPDWLRRALPRFDDFLDIRQRLDPHDLFVNDYIRRHLGV